MREIKFKFWDTALKNFTSNYSAPPKSIFEFGQSRYIALQYTGLKDKNGKEIYEGDIVKRVQNNGKETIHTIIFKDYRFAYTTKYYESISLNKVVASHQSLEVIGNIYEHPELLAPEQEGMR